MIKVLMNGGTSCEVFTYTVNLTLLTNKNIFFLKIVYFNVCKSDRRGRKQHRNEKCFSDKNQKLNHLSYECVVYRIHTVKISPRE